MSGYSIEYWPGTRLVKSVRSVASEDDVPEGCDFLPYGQQIPETSPAPLTDKDKEDAQRAILLGKTQLAALQKSALTNRIGVINDAIDLDEALPSELDELPLRNTQLTEWKKYAVLLGRVTLQPGWYESISWPEEPKNGMDLSVSPARNPISS